MRTNACIQSSHRRLSALHLSNEFLHHDRYCRLHCSIVEVWMIHFDLHRQQLEQNVCTYTIEAIRSDRTQSHGTSRIRIVLHGRWILWTILFSLKFFPRLLAVFFVQCFLFFVLEQSVMFVIFIDNVLVLLQHFRKQSIFRQDGQHAFLVRLKFIFVKLHEIILIVVTIDLLFVDDALADCLLGHLTLVDFLLHRSHREEAIDVARFCLTKAIHAENTLNIVRWIPGDIEDDDTICCDQIDAKTSGTC